MTTPSNGLREAQTLIRNGSLKTARTTLEKTLAQSPDDTSARQLLADLLVRTGAMPEAIGHYRVLAAQHPEDAGLRGNLGNVLLFTGAFGEAVDAYTEVLAHAPEHPLALDGLAAAHLGMGDPQSALAFGERAVKASPTLASAHYNLARAQIALGRTAEAEATLRRAVACGPGFADAHVNLGALLLARGQDAEAEARLREAVRINPRHEGAHYNLGNVLRRRQKYDAALGAYSAALELNPAAARTHAQIAAVLEQINRSDEARASAESALTLDPGQTSATLTLARTLRRSPDTAPRAVELLRGWISNHPEPSADGGSARLLLASLLDAAGETDQAWSLMTDGNTMLDLNGERDRETYRAYVSAYEQAFSEERLAEWPDDDDYPEAPVFIVGFPRSGTTLLDSLLRGHPALAVLEETDLKHATERRLWDQPGEFPTNVLSLESSELDKLRRDWLVRARELAGRRDGIIVDKLPLNLVAVPLLARLFPRARFVLALRHPMDAILSALMQDFAPNPAMAHLRDLDTAVALYVQVFKLWERYRRRLPLQVHAVRYEDVVADAEREMRALIAFLDLEWDDQVLAHRDRKGRGIATPSYHQVAQPIYDTAVERWRRYRDHIAAEAIERIAPVAQAYGYSVEP